MELALDIFRTDDFRATEMTEMVGDINTVPTFLDDLGIFQTVTPRTTTVTLYAKNNNLIRIPSSERGAPENVKGRTGGVMRQLSGTRLAQRDRITAKEVENLLATTLPTETRLANGMELVADRYAEMVDDDANTKEAHRFACITEGQVLDADGTVLFDFYDEFGIVKPLPIPIAMSTIAKNDLRAVFDEDVTQPMRRSLKGRWRPGTTIHALCGDEFWKQLTIHEGVQRIWALQEEKVELLGKSMVWKQLEFAGIIWHHYYGSDDETLEVQSNQAKLFPIGAKDVFQQIFFPGEDLGDINAKGKERYGVVSPDYRPNMNEWVDVYLRSYPLYACLAPQALVTLQLQ